MSMYPLYDPFAALGGSGFPSLSPVAPQFPQLPGMIQPPQGQGRAQGLLGNYVNPSTVSSFLGGGTGGANFGDQARNWLQGVTNPSDPYGVGANNARAGLNAPDASGATLTSMFGGDQAPSLVPPMQAPPLPQQSQKNSSSGGLFGMFGGGGGGSGGGGQMPGLLKLAMMFG